MSQSVPNMPMNNNQKAQSAAARLVKLPLVRSACSKLSVLYTDTKCSHPNLKTMFEVLENSVTAACDRASPVMVKLEPQISTANDVACISLDWLETTFPVLHTPTEQIAATARNKMHEIQDVVSIAVTGTMDCVQHTVAWVMERMQQVDEGTNQTLVERAIRVSGVGLDSALSMSEALIDRVLPPTERDNEETAAVQLVKGFEAATLRRNYPVRLVSLSAKLCRRTYHMAGAKMHSVQVCCHGDFVQVFTSGSGPPDNLADLDQEPPGAASVPAASGCVCAVLHRPDVQFKLPTV
ncbi:perilipin-2-like isoform X2 [Trachinotus anak]|uniref:perilipin-2-like isoform X2 n=1 Tax=Trachinotus anak TaxID=443729 RepID=UPI0039F23049